MDHRPTNFDEVSTSDTGTPSKNRPRFRVVSEILPSEPAPISAPVRGSRKRRRSNSPRPMGKYHQKATPLMLGRHWLDGLAGSKGWLLALLLLVWGGWNGKLLLSTAIGVGSMIGIYRMQEWDWSSVEGELQRWLGGFNRQLTLAVVCGGVTTLVTYMGVSIWTETSHPWTALGMILPNVGTATVLGLLLWQMLRTGRPDREGQLDLLLEDLTNPDPLKRLIAVRQITGLVKKGRFRHSHPVKSTLSRKSGTPILRTETAISFSESDLDDCFRLMLNQESEEIVRDALLDGLQVLDARSTTTRRSSYEV